MRIAARSALAVSLLAGLPGVFAQESALAPPSQRQWIAPTARSRAFAPADAVQVSALAARVRIDGAVARTRLRVTLANAGARPAEAELLLPVPDGAVIDHFDFQGGGSAASARLLSAREARATYDEIVSKLRDPALLEFAGRALVRSSVFPVPAGGTQAIELGYHEVLPAEGERLDYELVRTAALGATVPLDLELEIVGPAATVYSPTHGLVALERSPQQSRYKVDASVMESGSFRCAVLTGSGPRASLYACPDTDGPGGTFLLFAGTSAESAAQTSLRREVTLVLDRSGSMAGEKFAQALAAARQVLEGLCEGEAFRIVDYSDTAAAATAAPVVKSAATIQAARDYLARLTTGGGTNIAAALETAFAPEPRADFVPVVLFLTDGLPTVGPSSEAELKRLAAERNGGRRRLFPFGVGHDVNAPLLDHLAESSRGKSTYVRPAEDVELAVGAVFKKLAGPVLSGLTLVARDADGQEDTSLVRDLVPRELPDLFAGEPLVIVGRYTGSRAATLEIRPRMGSVLAFHVDLGRADRRNEFVPRLWATRRIGELTEAIRQVAGEGRDAAALLADARTQELSDEILRLSLRYGILSDFTSFLALEGSPLVAWNELETTVRSNLVLENQRWRSGAVAVQYAQNTGMLQTRSYQNFSNLLEWGAQTRPELAFPPLTASGASPESTPTPFLTVEPVQHGALFRRGDEWIEGQVLGELDKSGAPRVDRTVVIGTSEHRALVDELVRDGRADIAARGQVVFRHRGDLVRQVPAPAPPAQVPQR
jgi:Ca-activated chloride channel family protein